ncbi:MAG: endonuclease, partial [Firmicutes bacterium]|nr:endonuclease [Bacillota bacterium]
MRFGIHMPLKGGFEKNVRRCLEIGCNTLQIFAGNPTAWQAAKLNELELVGRKKLLEEHNIAPLIIHAAYLINL